MNAYRKEEKPVRLQHGMSKAQHTTCACMSVKGVEGEKGDSPLSLASGTKFTTRLRLMIFQNDLCSSSSIFRKSCSCIDGWRE